MMEYYEEEYSVGSGLDTMAEDYDYLMDHREGSGLELAQRNNWNQVAGLAGLTPFILHSCLSVIFSDVSQLEGKKLFVTPGPYHFHFPLLWSELVVLSWLAVVTAMLIVIGMIWISIYRVILIYHVYLMLILIFQKTAQSSTT